MELLWQAGTPLSAYDLLDRLPDSGDGARPRAATTVLTVLSRLERKGFVQRDRAFRPHRYRAAATRDFSLSICFGSGSWTRIPSTRSSALRS